MTDFTYPPFLESRLQLARAKGTIDFLNDIGLAAALIEDKRIVYANRLFGGVHPYFSGVQSGQQLGIKGNDSLRKQFAHALQLSKTESVSVTIPAVPHQNAAIIQLIPVSQDTDTASLTSYTKLIVAPVGTGVRVPPPAIVAELFGLTPTEARLAISLTSGLSLAESAKRQNITIGTARSYLIRVFDKTGTDQQSALVSLIKSVWVPPASDGT